MELEGPDSARNLDVMSEIQNLLTILFITQNEKVSEETML